MATKYRKAPEVAAVAVDIIAAHHDHLEVAPIRYVFRDKAARSQGKDVWGKARVVSGLNSALLSFEREDVLAEIGKVRSLRHLVDRETGEITDRPSRSDPGEITRDVTVELTHDGETTGPVPIEALEAAADRLAEGVHSIVQNALDSEHEGRPVKNAADGDADERTFYEPGKLGVLEIAYDVWRLLDDRARAALVDHELSHFRFDLVDGISTVGHDIEEFGAVVRRHGVWNAGLEEFARKSAAQMSLFLDTKGL